MEGLYVNNPFLVGKYLSDRYFCDRLEETEFLRKQILNGRNVALISPRRIGKSGLIQHFFNQTEIRDNYYVFFVDIYATTSLTEFVYTLGKEVYEQLKPQSTVWKEKFFQIISSFRVGFKLDALTGIPGLDIGLGDIQTPQTTLDEIFAYINEYEVHSLPLEPLTDFRRVVMTYDNENHRVQFFAENSDVLLVLRYITDGKDIFDEESENGVYLCVINRSETEKSYSADCSAAGLGVVTGVAAPVSGEIIRLK